MTIRRFENGPRKNKNQRAKNLTLERHHA